MTIKRDFEFFLGALVACLGAVWTIASIGAVNAEVSVLGAVNIFIGLLLMWDGQRDHNEEGKY